ncbi:MAG: asparagine synthase (glutamine-hydrolyzing) [Labilithrix sp.]
MCGIGGFVSFSRDSAEREDRLATLRRMSAQIAHRGPDDEQFYDDDHLSLVFRRLSIVDVGGGRQPIWNEDETAFVCVNGELYNHRELRGTLRESHVFRTASDSEIALHLYEELGPSFAAKLAGKFAVALWDKRRQRLVLARDPMGIKPMYLAVTRDGLLFGSELKALLTHPACPRKVRIDDLEEARLKIDRVPSYVEGVELLPGGCYATFDREHGLRVERYWSLEPAIERSSADPHPPSFYEERYRELFVDSVRMRLMADVPIGAFLSGGIDSSTVVATAAHLGTKLRSFNIVTRTTARNGDAASARNVASVLDVPLHQVAFDERTLPATLDLGLSTLEAYVWMMDSPRFDVAWIYTHGLHHFAKTHFPAIKVMMLGQGADEFAGGYSRMHAASPAQSWQNYLDELLSGQRVRAHMAPDVAALMRRPDDGTIVHDEMRTRLWTLQWFNLWHEDRTASAEGIESRVPFLDHRLVELLASVPVSLHTDLFTDKRIVRGVARAWLPDAAVTRTKVGFYVDDDMRPVDTLVREILFRSVDAFRDKYLGGSDAILDRRAFDTLVRFASTSTAPNGARVVRTLVRGMAFAIFERMCARIDDFGVAPLRSLPLLPEIGAPPPEWIDPPTVGEELAWASADRVALSPGIQIARAVDGKSEPTLLMYEGNSILADLELPDEALAQLLGHVVDPDHGHTVGDLARSMNASIADCSYALQFLVERGWVVRVQAERGKDLS